MIEKMISGEAQVEARRRSLHTLRILRPWSELCAGADPHRVVQQLRTKLSLNAAAVLLPIGLEDRLSVSSIASTGLRDACLQREVRTL
jgi:hypothetical protein